LKANADLEELLLNICSADFEVPVNEGQMPVLDESMDASMTNGILQFNCAIHHNLWVELNLARRTGLPFTFERSNGLH
jgi:hypothetical protein